MKEILRLPKVGDDLLIITRWVKKLSMLAILISGVCTSVQKWRNKSSPIMVVVTSSIFPLKLSSQTIIANKTVLKHRKCSPRNTKLLVQFSRKWILRFLLTLISEDEEFSCASFDLYEKIARGCPPTQTPTQKVQSGFSMFSSKEIDSSSISF